MVKYKNHKYTKFVLIILLLVFSLFIFSKAATISSILFQVVFNHNIELIKHDNRVNLLILGIGGGDHDGADLTDTMIFSSINIKDKKITLISIPRDLWIPEMGSKINNAYAEGKTKRKGGGIIEAKSVVSKVIGQPIDYVAVVDFSGFVKFIDLIDGVDVNVDNTFDDYQYPIEGLENDSCGHTQDEIKAFTATVSAELELNNYFICRYKHLHFDQGPTHLDGKTALDFVRSRHAQGDEGTDFARSKRQEKVMKAVKDKTLSLNVLLNPIKVINLYETVKGSIDTNIQISEFDDFIRLFQKMQKAQIESVVIDYGDKTRKGLLVHPDVTEQYKYQWVLIPEKGLGDYTDVQKYVKCEVAVGNCALSPK